jgi:hypothetical protein
MWTSRLTKNLLRRQPSLRPNLPNVALRPRSLASAAAKSSNNSPQPDLVKATIQKMMNLQQQQQSAAAVSLASLEKASHCLQYKLDQVKACLTDVAEEESPLVRRAELDTTDLALEEAAAAYVDLLDLVREADDTTAASFKELRQVSAAQIKESRLQLDVFRREE